MSSQVGKDIELDAVGRQFHITGCSRSPVRTLSYRRMHLHAVSQAHVVVPLC